MPTANVSRKKITMGPTHIDIWHVLSRYLSMIKVDVDGGVVSFPIISNGIEANYSMGKRDMGWLSFFKWHFFSCPTWQLRWSSSYI